MSKTDNDTKAFTEVNGREQTFINRNVLDALTRGSYEDRITSIAEMVEQQRDKFLRHKAEDKAVSLIATFERSAIIATDEGRLLRVEVLLNEADGSQVFGKIEEIEVPEVGREHLKDFTNTKIAEAVDHFIATGKLDMGGLSVVVGSYGVMAAGNHCD